MTDQSDVTARANPDLDGHLAAEALLVSAFKSDRLPHAWMITGPRGIGKATLAFRFARHVLAADAGETDLFGGGTAPPRLAMAPSHKVFRQVAACSHPDLITIERGVNPRTGRLRGEIVIEDARRLGAFLSLTPAESGWRVAIIDAVDEMNRNAANAVLKLVEEPPAQALILLVCHAPGMVPATIRSRCRRLALSPLTETLVVDLLGRRRPTLGRDDATVLARLAEGSPGRALALADHGGVGLYRELVELLGGLPALDAVAVHKFSDRLARRGEEAAWETAVDLLGGWVSRLVINAARGRKPSDIVSGEGAIAGRLVAARGLDQWLALWEKITDLAGRADRVNLDHKQVLLSMFTALVPSAPL